MWCLRFALAACLAVALLAAGYPMYAIRPFRAQGADELAVALVVRNWAPTLGTGQEASP
ncbi:MAG: hypothetical protein SGI92_15990 [Bryobacteraceae bacterium]|nr:hypothetical protein [Bryobacteraceae bacterium]